MSGRLSFCIWTCLSLAIASSHGAAIHGAVRAGNLAEVKRIVAAEPSAVNALGEGNVRPLHDAVPHPDIAEFLLAHGAEVNPGPVGDSSPLHLAVFTGQATVVRLLLQHGADVNAPLTNGLTALHMAALTGRVPVISLLLPHKAELNRKDKLGLTPLHYAAREGHLEAVRTLLTAGADAKLKNKFGFKPSDLVSGSDNDALADLLEKAEAGSRPVPIAVVAEMGDPSRLNFEGNTSFTSDALRNGLLMNPEYLLASHFSAPRDEYLATLQRLLERGYQAQGFFAPTASVALVESNIVVRIVEGRRYTKGDVQIRGIKTVPAQALLERLIRPYPPFGHQPPLRDKMGKVVDRKPALWVKGEAASFAPLTTSVLGKALTNILGEFGLFFSRTEVKVVPQEATGEALLFIDVLDEGPPGRAVQVEVSGNTRDSDEDVLAYLGLKPGLVISQNLLQQSEAKLWHSARFRQHHLTPEVIGSGTAAVRLKIELQEYGPAPPLTREFSPAEKTILRLRDWIEGLSNRQEEFVLGFTHENLAGGFIQLVLSQRGAALVVKPDAHQTNIAMAAVLTSQAVGLFSLHAKRKLVVDGLDAELGVSVSVLPDPDPKAAPFTLSVAGAFRNWTDALLPGEVGAPFRFDLTLAPVAFLDLIHRPGRSNWVENGVFVTQGSNELTRVELATGRLLNFEIMEGMQLSVESNYLARLQQQINGATADSPNALQPGRPLSSTMGYVVNELAGSPWLHAVFSNQTSGTAAQWTEAGRVVGTLLQQGILTPLDDWLQQGAFAEEDLFRIPGRPGDETEMTQLMAFVAAITHRLSNDLFPKRSWPWTIPREAVFVLLGQTRYTDLELERLYESPDTGPIGCLVAAELLNLTTSPHTKTFAARGLKRLEVEHFRNDCRLVLEGDTPLVRTVRGIVDSFAELSSKDLDALAAVTDTETGKTIRRAALLLRATRNLPLPQRVQPVLDLLWEQSWKKATEEALQELLTNKPVQNASLGQGVVPSRSQTR